MAFSLSKVEQPMRPKHFLNLTLAKSAAAIAVACTTSVSLVSPLMTSSVQAEAGGAGSGGIAEAASRYVIRLQERVKQADQAALRGNALMADGDYEQAMASFRDALALLPDATMTKDRRQAYITQYSAAAVALAKQRAEDGSYPDALALLDSVLAADVDPDNAAAKRLRQEIMDPEIYPKAMTPDLRNRIRTVDNALKDAQGAVDLGDYDAAARFYNLALANDPYNEAARRGLEKMERHKIEYFTTARDHTRAQFIREIEQGWELPVPRSIDNDLEIKTLTTDGAEGVAAIEEKLKTIILPSVEFVDTPLREALEFLTQKSAELDTQTTDPTKKGINFILSTGASGGGGGGGPAAGGGGFDAAPGAAPAAPAGGGFGGNVGDTAITLKLQNVPLVEAVRYTTSLAQLKYKVEPHAVVVVPLSTPDADLYTNVYQVPPTFLNSGGGDGGGAAAGPVDPFAAPAAGGGGGTLEARPDAKQILERAGVTFGEGASAIYQAAGSQLIVRNTQDQMELVEAYIQSIQDGAEKQIYITTKFIEIGQEVNDELGFDWLLGPFNINSSATTFGSGGTSGSQAPVDGADFPVLNPGGTPVGTNPVTAGNRSGGFAVSDDSIDGLIAAASGTGAGPPTKAPGIFGVAGVFTDVQYQVVIRALNQQKGVDLLSAPSVMARSGQRAKVEVIREFIYPTEYDPPEIPNQIGSTAGIGAVGGVGGGFPVTPANPTAFETRNTGVTLEVDPVIGADNFTIDLNLAPEVVEFEGFINYGSPIQTTSQNPITGVSAPVVLTENRILQPVFNTRRVTTQITIWDGQTVAIGGLIREDIQDVEDKVMLLGDLPVIGRLFRSSVERHLKRNLTVFVTAKIKDPSGQDFHGNKGIEAPEPMNVPPVPGPRPLSGPTVFAPMPGPPK